MKEPVKEENEKKKEEEKKEEELKPAFMEEFLKRAPSDGEIDAYELQELLNYIFPASGKPLDPVSSPIDTYKWSTS